jgi:N-acyl-D-amino-acid deacylase
MEYLIKNTDLFDGYQIIPDTDVLVSNNLVTKIEKDIKLTDEVVIDGTGLILSPGFVDIHTHTDVSLVFDDNSNLLSQGVTTVVGGNCGISGGFNNDPVVDGVINFGHWDIPKWQSLHEYWDWIQSQPLPVNYASLIGYHTLIEESQKTGKSATSLLQDYLSQGYFGLSTGMVYGWGKKIQETKDILELAQVLSSNKSLLTSHVKNQSSGLFDAVKLLTDLWDNPNTSNLHIQISHLKHMFADDPKGHETLKKVFDLVEDSLAKNHSMAVDVYPYTAGSTSLDLPGRQKQCLNGWFDVFPFGYSDSIGTISQKTGKSEDEVVQEILRKNSSLLAVYQNTCREEDVWEIVAKSYAVIASDGLPTHPRNWGTFPKVIKYAQDNNLDLVQYLSKMTSIPSKIFGLTGHGEIKVGLSANLVLFDPKTIQDNATYEIPNLPSAGIQKVWVDGNLAFDESRKVLGKFGKVVKKSTSL